MIDLEIPLGKRTLKYRLFEMLPATLSYGALILLIVLSIISPILAAIYVMLVIITLVVKAVGIAIHTIGGRSRLDKAQKVNWSERLADLENPDKSYDDLKSTKSKAFGALLHVDNLRLITADPELFPKPSALYNAVIIATYNEDYAVLAPTIQSVIDTSYDNKKIILTIAYEQRGGEAIKQTVNELKKEFGKHFFSSFTVCFMASPPLCS